jgi:hypothetical protein
MKQTSKVYKVISEVNSHHGQIMGVEEIVFESIDSFVPHKIMRKDSDPEVKRLKAKVRRVCNKR